MSGTIDPHSQAKGSTSARSEDEGAGVGRAVLARQIPKASLVSFHPKVVAAHRRNSLLMAAPGILGALLAPVYIWWLGFTAVDLLLFLGMYWLTLGLGLSVGYHRHFTHASFKTYAPIRWFMAACGSMGAQGSLTYWVAIHRRHHEYSDAEGDPHSPNLHGNRLGDSLRGLWHGHYGWSLRYGLPNAMHYCPDIVREPYLMAVNRHYRAYVLAGLLLPAAIGGLVTGTWQGALGGLLWGGMVRLFVSSNSTWALNSICHRFGTRAHDTKDQSGNVGWLALPTLGESWHNNHHAFPTAAAHGQRWWQIDLNYGLIWLLEKLRLAGNVQRPTR